MRGQGDVWWINLDPTAGKDTPHPHPAAQEEFDRAGSADQLRAIDRTRLIRKITHIDPAPALEVLRKMFAEGRPSELQWVDGPA